MKIVELKLENYKSFSSLHMNEKDLKDLLVFTGRNGTGKTAILEAIAYCLRPPNSGQQVGATPSTTYSVGPNSNIATLYIKVRLDDDEIVFIAEKFKELQDSRQIYVVPNTPSVYQDTVTPEFESTVIFHHSESPGALPSNTIAVNGNYTAVVESGDALKHPLSALVERQACQTVVFFNAYRQIDISANQIFSQMPQQPQPNQQSFAIQGNTMGSGNQNEHRQTMAFPLLRALNEIVLFEALSEFNRPTYQNKLADKLKPQLDLMNELLKPKQVLAPRFKVDQNLIEYCVKTSTSEHPIGTLSAGENELIILATYLMKAIDYRHFNGISPIVLIDEPELHLHAVYAERLAKFIKKIDFSKTNCLISSHSPDFIDVFNESLRKIEDEQVKTIVGLNERKGLFADIGRKITPSALVEQVVFVEGNTVTSKKLHDEEIYQRLLDPEIVKTLFVSVGDRIQARLAGHVSTEFVEAIRESSANNKVFMLTDGDDAVFDYNEPSVGAKVRPLNLYHVENLLLNYDAFTIATSLYGQSMTQNDTKSVVKAILHDLVEPTASSIRSVLLRREQLKLLNQLEGPATEAVDRKRTELEECNNQVEAKVAQYKADLETAIETDEWRRLFKGADIVREFNKRLNVTNRTSVAYVDLQQKLLDEIKFEGLHVQTQRILEEFRGTAY